MVDTWQVFPGRAARSQVHTLSFAQVIAEDHASPREASDEGYVEAP